MPIPLSIFAALSSSPTIDVPRFDHHVLLHDIDDVHLLHAIHPIDETVPNFHIPNTAAHPVLIADVLPDAPHIARLLQYGVHLHLHRRTLSTSKVSPSSVLHVQTISQSDSLQTKLHFINLHSRLGIPQLHYHHRITLHLATLHHMMTPSFLQLVFWRATPTIQAPTRKRTSLSKSPTSRSLIAGLRTTNGRPRTLPESKQPRNSLHPINGTLWILWPNKRGKISNTSKTLCMKLLPKSTRPPMAPSFGSRSPRTSSTTSRTALPELGCSIQILQNALNLSLWNGPINFSQLPFPRTLNSKVLGPRRATPNMHSTTKRIGRMFPRSFPSVSYARLIGPEMAMVYLNSFPVMVPLEWPVKSTQSQPLSGSRPLPNSPTVYSKSARANWVRGSSVFSNVLRWQHTLQVAMIKSKEGLCSPGDPRTTTLQLRDRISSPWPMSPPLRTYLEMPKLA